MSIGVPVPPIRPTFQTFSGMRRKPPVSRVQSSLESWMDRPALARRWRQRVWSGHSARTRQEEAQISPGAINQMRASAIPGWPANPSTMR